MRHGVGIGSVDLIAGREDVNRGFGGAFHDGAANNSPPFLGLGFVRGFPLIRTWFVGFSEIALRTLPSRWSDDKRFLPPDGARRTEQANGLGHWINPSTSRTRSGALRVETRFACK